MIRKNDSCAETWKKTITPKANWHISKHSIYNYEKRKGNWGRRGIGVHYADGTNRYQKHLISEYSVLDKIQKIINKQKSIFGVLWPDKIVYKSYKDFKEIIHMAKNIANKYGFKLIRSDYEEHFPYVRIERVRDYYVYPYL